MPKGLAAKAKAKSKSSDAASVKANGAKANGEQLTKAEVRKQLRPARAAKSSSKLLPVASVAVVAVAAVALQVLLSETTPERTADETTPEKFAEPELAATTPNAAAAKPPCPANCTDKDPSSCPSWAASGECTDNPGYMLVQCACSCDSCDQVDYKVRCKLDPDAELAVPPGAMGETFERILSDFPQLHPTVLSRDPWLLQLDAFLDDEEASAFVRQGSSKGFETSADTGKMRADGSFESIYSSHRTSQTAWMDTSPSLDDAVLNRVMARAANVTRVPTSHSEYVQVLRYGVGQYYQGHHDYIPAHAQLPCGPRVYTLFMYLSDVDEGGETAFERLKVSATPKRGRALLWPSTFDDRPTVQDMRTFHEAKPVKRGVKHAANLWLHQHDFRAAHRRGCSG